MKRTLVLFILLLSACATVPSGPPVHLVIVGTTDVHGWFNGHVDRGVQYGGIPLFASYVSALRAEGDDHVVLVDSGDLFQGTLESNYFEGEPVVRAYNLLGYAAAAVGNHEFDYGPAGPDAIARVPGEDPLGALKKNAALARFPFLSANMTEKATGRTPSWARPYTMIDVAGVHLGIIGLSTPDTPNTTVGANVVTLNFGDPVKATVAAARDLRASGADAVIVIGHMGGRCADVKDVHDVASCRPEEEAMTFLQRLPHGTIDAYFAGHTHQQMRQIINGVPAVQALAYSVEFSTIDLWVDPSRHRVDPSRTTLRPLTMICGSVYSGSERCEPPRDASAAAPLVPRTFLGRTITPDPAVTSLLAPYLDRVAAKRSESIGVRTAALFTRSSTRESALGDLIADALRAAMHSDMAFMNSGGIRSNLRAGDLAYSDIFEVSPFDNYPAVIEMTGAQITQALQLLTSSDRGLMQVSGLRYTVDAQKPAADRLVAVTLDDGTPIDPAKLYRVAMPDFLASGGDGLLPVMRAIPAEHFTVLQDRTIRDVLPDVLRTFPQPLVPKTEGRIIVLNPPPSAHQ